MTVKPDLRDTINLWAVILVPISMLWMLAYLTQPDPVQGDPGLIHEVIETYKPKLFTVVTREGTYKDLRRAGSGDYETPEGKTIGFHEPYTEFEQ